MIGIKLTMEGKNMELIKIIILLNKIKKKLNNNKIFNKVIY
jgi:hypothetical protein